MRQQKISVIIPVYNAESFLHQCLDSVINQSMKELEIICVNDGSTDSSPQILEEYAKKDERICVVHQQNLHAGVARNTGIEAATGEYIHFLDADDYLVDNVYDKIYEIAIYNELDYLMFKAYTVNTVSNEKIQGIRADVHALKSMPQECYVKPFKHSEAPNCLTEKPVVTPWHGIYRRCFINDNSIRFISTQSYNDISFFYTVIARAERIMAADVYVVLYRINNPNSLVGQNLGRLGDHIEAINAVQDNCHFLPPESYATILNAVMRSFFFHYMSAVRINAIDECTQQTINDTVNSFDISLVEDICKKEQWYVDYLMTRLEISNPAGDLQSQDEALVNELVKCSVSTMPIPLYKLKRNSEIVLYGAGYMGYRIYKLFRLTQYCEIVIWVDREWEHLQSENMPVKDPNEITHNRYDSILIAIESEPITEGIKEWLLDKGISKEVIISK